MKRIIIGIAILAAFGYLIQPNESTAPIAATTSTPEEIAERRQAHEQAQAEARQKREAAELEARQTRLVELMLNPESNFNRRAEARRTLEAMGAEVVAKHRDSIRKFAAEQRKTGVWIGMTTQDVLHSSWGKPTRVNRSTYSFGVHEQWVYGSGNYLYFENGILKSIQN